MTLNQLTLEWNGTRLCRMVGVALGHVMLQVGVAQRPVMLQVGVALSHKACHVTDHRCQS